MRVPATSGVGQIERRTQNRVVQLFKHVLGYDYLGNYIDRPNNGNVEESLLRAFLKKNKYSDELIGRALYELGKAAGDGSKSLYDRNRTVYELLRYGVKVKTSVTEQSQTVWLVDWKHPELNHFALAEEVTVRPASETAHGKRPDIVLYVNGIALGVLELKRSTISVSEGIRQNLDNQEKRFIEPFFSTLQLIMAGNDSEGMRYGTIQTSEKYYLAWKEDDGTTSNGSAENKLDRQLRQMCGKSRFLELIHDFVAFDSGTKKLCRQNQYFGVKAAQEFLSRREGGILWHTQGSGKSLTMVWLAKWLRENRTGARVLIVTDRTELDQQIETVFKGVSETIHRTRSGADLIYALNASAPWFICSLIHKFGGMEDGEEVGAIGAYTYDLKAALPKDFRAKGDVYVFVDECHRTQSGELHNAMKTIVPDAVFVGFTGTPLLKADKQKSIEIFGRYIHTYKFDEAVEDKVVLDLRYEARDIAQSLTSPAKIDAWFEAKTRGLNDVARAQLKLRWGTLRKVLSSQDRLEQIVDDILFDFATRDRLLSGRGNAMLVSGSIYQACKLYELFAQTDLAGKIAIVTSYQPTAAAIKGEETGEGTTEKLRQHEIYGKMMADWFGETPEKAVNRIEEFEKAVKKKFIEEPGQMKLLIVVDKLLTGFDAPPATYLYIDKQMRDHGLFQAICRVNRLDGDDKDYGYVVDYKDLFRSLETSIQDYTSGALDGYDKEDVNDLLVDRLEQARQDLEDAREAVRALCEPVNAPRDTLAYLAYFCGTESADAGQLKANEPNRVALYKFTAALVRAYAGLANELAEAGYTPSEIAMLRTEVDHFEKARSEVKLASGDYIDLKMYEPAMRHLIDTYIRAAESEKISAFNDLSLVQLIVERGAAFVDGLPASIQGNQQAVAETVENNVRKLIIDESPVNPRYYGTMSTLLDALIVQRKADALSYKDYLAKVVELTIRAQNPASATSYPSDIDSPGKRALYDNLDRNEDLALAVNTEVIRARQDDWRSNPVKIRKVRYAIKKALSAGEATTGQAVDLEALTKKVIELVERQYEY